jgi:hypothetical protein
MNARHRYSFDHKSCREHLDKLLREADRLEQSETRADKSDHAINGAWTGWHLHEWIWSEMKEIERSDPPIAEEMDDDTAEQIKLQHKARQRACAQIRADVAKDLGISVGSVDAKAFGAYMARQHRVIEICRIIATGSKHTQVDDLKGIEVETLRWRHSLAQALPFIPRRLTWSTRTSRR